MRGFGRGKAVARRGMTAGAAGQAGMVHRGRRPYCADRVAVAAGAAGHRGHGMRLAASIWDPCARCCLVRDIMTTGQGAIVRRCDPIMLVRRACPGGCSVA